MKLPCRSVEETQRTLAERFASREPFTFLRFGDCDLMCMYQPGYPGNRRHDNVPGLAEDLRRAWGLRHPDYLIATIPGSRWLKRDADFRAKIAEDAPEGGWLHAVAYHLLYIEDPEGFIAFNERAFSGRRVLLVGGPSVCDSALVQAAFHVTEVVSVTDRNAYQSIEKVFPQIVRQAERHDVVVSALGQATRVLGEWLWGLPVQYFDVGSVVDALAGLKLRSWIVREWDKRRVYADHWRCA